MDDRKFIEESEKHLLHVYNRFPVVFDHGEGMYLYDVCGKAYLDFAAGIGVSAFGYGDGEYEEALCTQVKKLMHVSNLYYHTGLSEAAEAVCRVSGMDKVFFTNSGAEAIEGALKTAKKYGYVRDGHAGHEIIAMNHSFHGRTVGALSVTGNEHYREPFAPLMGGVRFADFNDLSSVESQINDKTIAIILEPVQGEGGITPATEEFLSGIEILCEENGLLLIFDEIQCGMGRTGNMFVWQEYNIRPDILTTAKALGGGVPVGAFAITDKVARASMVPGDHGTTYGGNPFVLAGVKASIDIMEKRHIPEHVRELAPYLEQTLDGFVRDFEFVEGRRGMGFMQGLILSEKIPVGDVVSRALDYGLIVLSAGGNVLRLLPPLIAEKRDIDAMREILEDVLRSFAGVNTH